MTIADPAGENPPVAAPITACVALSRLAGELLRAAPDLTPRLFLIHFARQAAGIDEGLDGIFDLLKGGENRIPGRGFCSEFDDGSEGQARHFAGIVDSVVRFGPDPTEWTSVNVRRDAADSPDGRLTEAAIRFADGVLQGEIALRDAEDWIRCMICCPT